jgi:hypothetical protein
MLSLLAVLLMTSAVGPDFQPFWDAAKPECNAFWDVVGPAPGTGFTVVCRNGVCRVVPDPGYRIEIFGDVISEQPPEPKPPAKVIYYYLEGGFDCPACRQLNPTISKMYSDGWPMESIDGMVHPDWCQTSVLLVAVSQFPSTVVICGHKEVDRVVGVKTESELKAFFEKNGVVKGPSR